MARLFCLLFGVASYLLFFVVFVVGFISFVGNFPFMPVTVDRGGPVGDTATAMVVDLALIALFGIQHSVMARKGFKQWWTTIIPKSIERSTYVLISTLLLVSLMILWRPIPATVWSVESEAGAMALWVIFFAGWAILLLSSFLINHFELFGLQQVWQRMKDAEPSAPKFVTPFLYRMVRHPLYTGMLMGLWAIPVMTTGHLLLAAGMSVYILIGVAHEERDLLATFGQDYSAYQSKVGKLVPWLGRTAA